MHSVVIDVCIQCVPGLVTDGDGRIIVNGGPANGRIVKIELAPDFVILDALENK